MTNRIPALVLAACALLAATGLEAGTRRALLVAINDYSASRLGAIPSTTPVPDRDWPNLAGTVNDAEALQEMLVLLHGFDRRDIVILENQAATRGAILQAIDRHLLRPAAKGDILFFYYAGHGSQVRNSRSDEPDRMDESLVPADSRAGARDIRDKELRPLFNRILDRGARLTVILDNCHSGSGARGLQSGGRPRGVRPDRRDVADGSRSPRPEDRGALVVAASQDDDAAWEMRDREGRFHGAFSWAWLRAMRDSPAGESAAETFLRAQARLRAEKPYQEPVLAGNPDARLAPFLGIRGARTAERPVVAVKSVQPDGNAILQGGWANGLEVGSELRLSGQPRITARLTVTALRGLGESAARIGPPPVPLAIRSGALLEIVGWAAPPAGALRVWMPSRREDDRQLARVAQRLSAAAAQRRIRWVTDPVAQTPTHLLRPTVEVTQAPGHAAGAWQLLGPDGRIERVRDDDAAIAAVAAMPAGASLFVQFPAPRALVDAIAVGPGTDLNGIEPADHPEDADYLLAGRYAGRRLTYAWIRPAMRRADRRRTSLPPRTSWIAPDGGDELRDAVLRLRRIQGWLLLESPPMGRSPYRLGIRRKRDDELVRSGIVAGGEQYDLLLRAATLPLPVDVPRRFFYIFTIDSDGRSTLLFPRDGSGSVENRFPMPRQPGSKADWPPPEIPLDPTSTFRIAAPYGIDTYFLLSTDDPLPNPWILQWTAVRTRRPAALTPLEELLLHTATGTRSPSVTTPASWSLERVVVESVRKSRRG
ncbi:MAG: peptidase caspase catalytic subunit p20 [Acidobacteria bacterium]|nr:peptidase caspase catalytic subunit p20 [Acidobacteriota bacterium]